ncbi:hypothetical protein HXX76_001497 [Chlamydomonas incerta]|uniref:Vacuolar protein 8 n=1 Tax=Chlamydomonas incerta TaxID=51695 RepID=A0A835WC93_CHLIN|nr:hypothetical protein HXX76_001497 [Chlamydomonas incerta]|eukprot:KAG2444753.1 hypothetical protein HXX76_001497 [Chlamydomonas incerta]
MDTAAVAQAAVEKFIAEEALNLSDADKRAKAMAGICILLTQLQEPSVPKELENALPSIVELTQHSEDRSIQANACAVLSGLCACTDDLQAKCIALGAVEKVLALVLSVADTEERTVQLNALGSLTELLRDNEAKAEELVAAGGLEQFLRLCDPALPERLQEAAADVVCSIACSDSTRAALSEQGAVSKLAALLATPNNDVRVRALMGLGMLLSKNQPNQLLLAKDTAAVKQLMAIMRQQEDPDCRIVARDLFAGLAANADCKEHVAAAMRA